MRAVVGMAALALPMMLLSTAAGACSLGWCFGAIAVGPHGAVGTATHLRTAPEAVAAAKARCGAECGRVEVFHSGCAALASDAERTPHFGFADDRQGAVAEALELCGEAGARCALQIWVCSR